MKSITLWGIYSAWYRHYARYRKTLLINCVPPLSEPVVYLVGMGYGLMPIIGSLAYYGKPVDYMVFLTPGMIAVGVLFQSFFEASYGCFFRFNHQKTWHLMLTTPLTFDEVFAGAWYLELWGFFQPGL